MSEGVTRIEEQVVEITKAWAARRVQYPGWLVAPYRNRKALWDSTRAWVWPIQKALPSLELGQRIETLFEVNWRIERCLVPLWQELADDIVNVLQSITQSSTDEAVDARELGTEGEGTDNVGAWKRSHCANLTSATLRFARESRNEEWFAMCSERLQGLSGEFPEVAHRLSYERVLWAVYDWDYQHAAELLGAWDATHHDPFWRVRRASGLAEVDRLQEAEDEANAALIEIRERVRRSRDDIWLLSREGWTMLLLRSLRWQNRFPKGIDTSLFLGRWRRLESYWCNPMPELERMQSVLDRRPPEESTGREQHVGFDPGTRRSTLRMGGQGIFERVLPAFQFVRLSEESAYLPRFGNMNLCAQQFMQCAAWVERVDPVAAVPIVLRAARLNDIDQFFCRHRIAVLPDDTVSRLQATVAKSLGKTTPVLSQAPGNAWGRGPAMTRTQIALELLSRLAPRLPTEGLDEGLQLAMAMYRDERLQRLHMLASPLNHLFKRVLDAMPPHIAAKHAKELISLPVPGTSDSGFALPEAWRDPGPYLPEDLCNIPIERKGREWGTSIRRLVQGVSSGAICPRSHAAIRLAWLYRNGILRKAEVAQFTRALWARRDKRTGLPSNTLLYASAFLWLPEPEAGAAQRAFRQHCLHSRMMRLIQTSTGEDGNQQRSYAIMADSDRLPREIVAGTMRYPVAEDNRIDWSEQEVSQVIQNALDWWDDEHEELLAQRDSFLSGAVGERVSALLELLRVTVIPRLSVANPVWERIQAFLDAMPAADCYAEALLPSLLQAWPGRADEVASRLRRGLASSERAEARSAVAGVYHWVKAHLWGRAPDVPGDLLRELGSIVSNRRQPAMLYALIDGAEVVKVICDREEEPSKDSKALFGALTVGLEYLLHEASYRKTPVEGPSTVPYELVPEYRAAATTLAMVLKEYARIHAKALDTWQELALNDPLPEVRNAARVSKP